METQQERAKEKNQAAGARRKEEKQSRRRTTEGCETKVHRGGGEQPNPKCLFTVTYKTT